MCTFYHGIDAPLFPIALCSKIQDYVSSCNLPSDQQGSFPTLLIIGCAEEGLLWVHNHGFTPSPIINLLAFRHIVSPGMHHHSALPFPTQPCNSNVSDITFTSNAFSTERLNYMCILT